MKKLFLLLLLSFSLIGSAYATSHFHNWPDDSICMCHAIRQPTKLSIGRSDCSAMISPNWSCIRLFAMQGSSPRRLQRRRAERTSHHTPTKCWDKFGKGRQTHRWASCICIVCCIFISMAAASPLNMSTPRVIAAACWAGQ